MATKSDFSSVEWKKVLDSVGWVYRALTEAEHSGLLVRRQESGEFNKYIKEYKGSSQLVKEIIADQKNADDKLSGDADASIKALDEVGNLVEAKAGASELDALRAFLVGSAEALAKAVKEDRGKDADNISDIEQGIINRISAALTPAVASAPAQAPSATRGGFTVGPTPVQPPAPAAPAPAAPKPAMPGIPAMPAAPSPDVLKAQADAAAAKLKAEADAKAKQLADAKAAADAQAAKLKAEADAAAAKLKAEADAKAKQLADAKAAAEAQAAKVKAEAEAKAKELADIKAKAEAEAKAKVEAEAAKMRAELEQAKAAAEKAKAEAEAEKARLEAEAKARAEALAKAQAAEAAQHEEAAKAKLAQEQAEAAAAAKARTHTVKANETLSHISLHYYGTANRWQEIFEANRDTIKDARLIYPGQVLRIP